MRLLSVVSVSLCFVAATIQSAAIYVSLQGNDGDGLSWENTRDFWDD